MRRLLSAGLVALVALVATACSGTPSATDPYQLVFNAKNAGLGDQVQIDLAVSAQAGSDSINLQPGAVRLVLDTKAGKGLFHLSIPTSILGSDAASLAQLGVTGDTIDADVLYDGNALYVKSPLAPSLIQLLMASTGGTAPQGDLTGWIQLGTAADFGSLAALAGGSITGGGSATAPPTISTADELKTNLTSAGITLTFVATEQHNGVNADHVSAVIDWQKLASSDIAKNAGNQSSVQQFLSAGQSATFTTDLWLDHSSGKLVAVELKGASKADATQTFDVNVTFKAPDAGQSLDTPASSVSVPLIQMLGPLMQGVLGGGLNP